MDRSSCDCQFRYNVTTASSNETGLNAIYINHFLNLSQDLTKVSPVFCYEIFNFSTDLGDRIENDLKNTICSFATLIYPLIYDPQDPFLHWAYVLQVSQVSDAVLDAFNSNRLNMTLDPRIATLNCNGTANLTVSKAGSECGYLTCPYAATATTYGPFDILMN